MPSNVYRFVEHWAIPDFPPQDVYEVISDARLLPVWWKGVYLVAEPLDGQWMAPRVGGRIRAIARGFLPYTLRLELESTVLEPGRMVEVRIRGDLDGIWRATLSVHGHGTRVDIEEQVVVKKPLIRVLSPLLKPLLAWNHFWTTPRGKAGLSAYLANAVVAAEGRERMSSIRPLTERVLLRLSGCWCARIGHASPSFTLATYAHAATRAQEQAATIANELLEIHQGPRVSVRSEPLKNLVGARGLEPRTLPP